MRLSFRAGQSVRKGVRGTKEHAKAMAGPHSGCDMAWIREPNAEPIPGYRLIAPLGSGGFGEVWKCEAPGGWIKAIKFVYGNRNSVDNDSIRADQEYKSLQRIKEVRHPFVCSVEQTLEINGELIIVMEFAD